MTNREYEVACARARAPKAQRQAAYDRWHAQLPFTDEEIIGALEELAAEAVFTYAREHYEWEIGQVRLGFVSKKILRETTPLLVKRCGVCGKTALYRYGAVGRCREHRLVAPDFVREKAHRLELLAEVERRRRVAWDSASLSLGAFKRNRDGHAGASRRKP